ncbi:MFS transporter [candidate division KSB1 bacterium]
MKNKDNQWFTKSLLYSSGHFVSDIYPGFLAPILPLLIAKFGLSLTFAAFLASISSFSASMNQIIFGYLSDKYTSRFFIIFGPVISAVFYSSMGWMPDKYLLAICVFCGGMGVAMFHPLAAKMTNQVGENHKGTAMSIFVTGGSIGYSIGPLVVTYLIALKGIKIVPVAIVPALIMSVIMVRFSPIPLTNNSKHKNFVFKENIKALTSIGIYVSIGTIRSITIMGFNTFIPILYAFRQESLEAGAFAIFIMHVFGGIGGLVGGLITDKVSPKLIISLSFVLATPVLYIFLHSFGVLSLIALGLTGGLLHSSIPAVITQAQSTMPEHMATVSSMVMGFSWGLGGIMVILVGKSADLFGLLPTLNVLAFFPLIGFVLSLLLHHRSVDKIKFPDYI